MIARRLPFRFLPWLVVGSLLPGCAPEGADLVDEWASAREDDVVATFGGDGSVDTSRTTRILLVGDSDKLGVLPLHAATTRARRYRLLDPSEQIVLFVTKDDAASKIAKTGAALVADGQIGTVDVSELQALEASVLVEALDAFERIASIDFFGHSSPFGVLLEAQGYDHVLNASLPAELVDLKDNFARDVDPYITLNGCNGAAETAPKMSALLELPVAGALTGSMFQTVMSDGRWYFDDPAFMPAGLEHVAKNTVSFEAPNPSPSCSKGACIRMKPQDSPYRGVWADAKTGFQYGLNHYKFFCAYGDGDESCLRGMARALYAWPSVVPIDTASPVEDVERVLVDYFCSTNVSAAWFDQCATGLRAAAESNTGYSTMKSSRDYMHECDMFGCDQELRCATVQGVPQRGTCAWVAPGCPEGAALDSPSCKVKNATKKTTVDEWHRFLAGHALM